MPPFGHNYELDKRWKIVIKLHFHKHNFQIVSLNVYNNDYKYCACKLQRSLRLYDLFLEHLVDTARLRHVALQLQLQVFNFSPGSLQRSTVLLVVTSQCSQVILESADKANIRLSFKYYFNYNTCIVQV